MTTPNEFITFAEAVNANDTQAIYGNIKALHKVDIFGNSILMFAIEKNHIEVIKYVIRYAPQLVSKANKGWRTPLLYAISLNNIELVKMLVEGGANLEAKDILGRTALYFSWHKQYDDISRYLISKGSRTTLVDKNGLKADIDAANYTQEIVEPPPNVMQVKMENALSVKESEYKALEVRVQELEACKQELATQMRIKRHEIELLQSLMGDSA